jgi:hypothetical protein
VNPPELVDDMVDSFVAGAAWLPGTFQGGPPNSNAKRVVLEQGDSDRLQAASERALPVWNCHAEPWLAQDDSLSLAGLGK